MQRFYHVFDDLAVRDIQEKLFPHPLAPGFPLFGMAGWAESAGS
jgi:hypothetical protein